MWPRPAPGRPIGARLAGPVLTHSRTRFRDVHPLRRNVATDPPRGSPTEPHDGVLEIHVDQVPDGPNPCQLDRSDACVAPYKGRSECLEAVSPRSARSLTVYRMANASSHAYFTLRCRLDTSNRLVYPQPFAPKPLSSRRGNARTGLRRDIGDRS